LTNQVKDAHAAQSAAENRLLAEQKFMESYRHDIDQLREKANSQSIEISSLQSKLAKAEQE